MKQLKAATPRSASRWAAIHALQQHNWDLHLAAAATKKPLKFVKHWAQRYRKTQTVDDSPRSGRPRRLNSSQQEAACQQVEQQQSVPAAAASLKQQGVIQASVSSRTVSRSVREKMKLAPVQQRPPLTQKTRGKRMAFSELELDPEQLVSLDSTYFVLHGGNKRRKRWVRKGEKAVAMRPCKSQQLHVYGAITAHGKSELLRVSGTSGHPKKYYNKQGRLSGVGAQEFQEVMGQHLIPAVEQIAAAAGVGEMYWLIDNAPAHSAKSTKRFLDRKGICRCKNWPPHSPDLMPIENMWALVKREVYRQPHISQDELWVAVQAAWAVVPDSTCRNLMHSVPQRQQRCLELDGGHIGM